MNRWKTVEAEEELVVKEEVCSEMWSSMCQDGSMYVYVCVWVVSALIVH